MRGSSITGVRGGARQDGVILIEALVAILVFALGVLGIVGLQAVSLKHLSDSRSRVEAQMLASGLIGQMWSSNLGSLAADFASPSGPAYVAWKNNVKLPGASSYPPTVQVDANKVVTVTIQWKEPGQSAPSQYVVVTQLAANY